MKDSRYNLASGTEDAEKRHGITTIHEHNGFKTGEQALYSGHRGTIRRFTQYSAGGTIHVDFLLEGYTHTGVEGDAAHLEKL